MHQNVPFPLKSLKIFWGGGTAPSPDPFSHTQPRWVLSSPQLSRDPPTLHWRVAEVRPFERGEGMVTICPDNPGWSFISGSWISRCPGFVLDLKSSDPSLEDLYLSQYYILNVRLLTTALYRKHPAGRKTARNLVSWFSAKSLKLLPPVVRFQR